MRESKLSKLEGRMEKIDEKIAGCRKEQQIEDHDKIILLESNVDNIKEDQVEMTTQLKDASGNINQTALIIKDLQRTNKLYTNMKITIISGIIISIISALLIYIFTLVVKDIRSDEEHLDKKVEQIISVERNLGTRLEKLINTLEKR